MAPVVESGDISTRCAPTFIDEATLNASWENLEFTFDPIRSSLLKSAEDAEEVGLLEPVSLDGIYSLGTLNKVLKDLGKSEIAV